MPPRSDTSRAPDPSAIRAGLDRVVSSNPFNTSPKLTSFLRFVVESTLAGRGERLKGYTIGVEALGRGENFNPQIDPIVRVEAIRLRAGLVRYYAGAGAHDPLVIEMPRGHYVTQFRYRIRSGAMPERAIWRQIVQTIHRFLNLRVTIRVQDGLRFRDGISRGALAAPGARLLPDATIAPLALTPDGRQEQQVEGASAARARRPGTG